MEKVASLTDILHERDEVRRRQACDLLGYSPSAAPEEIDARIERYRRRAEELRIKAEDVVFYETKQALLSLAYSYAHMAETLHRSHNRDH